MPLILILVSSLANKVGLAQQWFDELDNLAFTRPEEESEVQGEEEHSDRSFRDKSRVHVDCAVNISPGTSEVCSSLRISSRYCVWEFWVCFYIFDISLPLLLQASELTRKFDH